MSTAYFYLERELENWLTLAQESVGADQELAQRHCEQIMALIVESHQASMDIGFSKLVQPTAMEWGYIGIPTGVFPPAKCQHEFPNTGMAKSWCKKCDVEGVFDTATGNYIPKGD